MMSHELRTPLNAIGGYAQLIELGVRGPVTAEQREDLERIERSQRHLLRSSTTSSTSRSSRRGASSFDDRAGVAARAARERRGARRAAAPREGARATSDGARSGDAVVLADAEKARQILLNLLSNAIKFTPPGGAIELDCGGRRRRRCASPSPTPASASRREARGDLRAVRAGRAQAHVDATRGRGSASRSAAISPAAWAAISRPRARRARLRVHAQSAARLRRLLWAVAPFASSRAFRSHRASEIENASHYRILMLHRLSYSRLRALRAALVLCAVVTPPVAAQRADSMLTVERIFSSPELSTQTPYGARWRPGMDALHAARAVAQMPDAVELVQYDARVRASRG